MQVREFRESDAPDVVALTNAALNRNTTPQELLVEVARAAGVNKRWVLLDGEQVVGTARLYSFPFTPPGYLQTFIVTDVTGRGQGRGEALWQTLRAAVPEGVLGLSASVRDDDPHSLGWAQRRGFTRQVHRFASALDLLTFGPTPFQPYLERATAQGITFTTLEGADEETLARYIEFHSDRLMDTPDLAGHPRWSVKEVRRTLHLDDDPHPEWIFLAVSPHGKCLGSSALVC